MSFKSKNKKTVKLSQVKKVVDTILHDSEMEMRNLFESHLTRYNTGINLNTVELQDQLRKIRAHFYGLALMIAATNGFDISELIRGDFKP